MKVYRRLALSIIMIISAIMILFSIKDGHNWGGDFSLYIAQAKAIIDFSVEELYELNKFSSHHSVSPAGPFLYPFGFPVLLSPIYYFFGMNFIVMKVFCSVFLILSLPLIYKIFKKHFSNILHVYFIIIGIAFHVAFVTFTDNILSDLPFYFFSLLSFWFMTKSKTVLGHIVLGVVIFFSYFIRDIGIVLIPTLLVYQIQTYFNNRNEIRNLYILAIPYIIFVVFFVLITVLLPVGGENHYQMLIDNLSFDLIKWNIEYNLSLITIYYFGRDSMLLSIFLLVLMIIGMLRTWRQNLHFIIYTLLICAVLLSWRSTQGIRFLFPILPFLTFFILKGGELIWKKFKLNQKYFNLIIFVFIGISLIIQLKYLIRFNKKDTNKSYSTEMVHIYNYISENIPKDEIIGFHKPRVLRLFTDRNSIFTNENHFSGSTARYLLIRKSGYDDKLLKYSIIYKTENYVILTKD